MDDVRLSNMIDTCPDMRSISAGPLPLYGTCSIFTPVIMLKSSADMWIEVPLPEEAKLIWPGLDLASAMNSLTVLAGTAGCTSMTFGTRATSATDAKSRDRE